MTDLFEVAQQVQTFAQKNEWSFCFIGGIAVQHWGEPRVTLDVDLTLLTGFGEEESYIDTLLEEFPGRISNTKEFALLNRVLLLKSSGNVGIDIALGALPFEEEATLRAKEIEITSDISLQLCTAEDLLVMKAFANRPRDWVDIESVIKRQESNQLDWEYIVSRLTPLADAKESPEILTRLKQLK